MSYLFLFLFHDQISVGQIVAAPFDHDDKWYRAEIIEIERNEYDPAESKVTVYYGDYGDTCTVRRKQLFDLRTDYLTLYFQAIECILAKVKPLYVLSNLIIGIKYHFGIFGQLFCV